MAEWLVKLRGHEFEHALVAELHDLPNQASLVARQDAFLLGRFHQGLQTLLLRLARRRRFLVRNVRHGNRQIEDLMDLPLLTDPDVSDMLGVFTEIVHPAMFYDEKEFDSVAEQSPTAAR